MKVSRALFLALLAGCREKRDLPVAADDAMIHDSATADTRVAQLVPVDAAPDTESAPIASLHFAGATSVETIGGNIVAQVGTTKVLVTAGGHDSAPSLSPDGRVIVFIRERFDGPCIAPTGERGCSECEELWIVRSGSAPARLLAGEKPWPPAGPRPPRAGASSPKFSNDGQRVYFTTTAGCTAGSIVARALDLVTMKETILIGEGAVDHEVSKGPFAGQLVIRRFAIEWDPITKASLGRIESWVLITRAGAFVRKLPDDETKRRATLGE